MKIIRDEKRIDDILNRGTIAEILPDEKEFRRKLLSGERMRFYIGFDATAPNLHLSHAKNFILMEKFRKLGHEIIILFGDFTARIGDPSDKKSARKQLTASDVARNIKEWKNLVKPLMDFNDKENPPIVKYNSEWLSALTMEEVVNLAGLFTVQQMLERDMFQKRIKEKTPIYLHEFLYPLMQGYDSVAMEVDVEVCGTDQTFNALAGRTLLRKLKEKEKFVVAVTLMENPKTKEVMSKSRGTGVFLDVSSEDMYGQIMAQPDEMIRLLFVNCTLLELEEIEKILKAENPKDSKMRLAFEIVKMLYGEKKATEAEENFGLVFKEKKVPLDIPKVEIKEKELNILDLLVVAGLTKSKADAKRLIFQGGIKINKEVQLDWKQKIKITEGTIIQAGKRKFVQIK